MKSTSEPSAQIAEEKDRYTLRPEDIKEPPRGWRHSLKYFGPGLLLSAGIVGSGELIATTTLGAEAGFALLWFVIISTTIKVAIQVEFARWTIVTGQPALDGLNKIPPRIGGRGWAVYLWLLVFLAKMVQYGGIIGAIALACSALVPIGGALTATSVMIWTGIIAVIMIVGLYSNKYERIESVGAILVVCFTVFSLIVAFGLPWTPFAYNLADLGSGLSFSIPAGAIGIAVAMFGISGVGSDEVMIYNYWCLEKGYARFTGPRDGSKEWTDRADGWIRVMYKDVGLSWLIYTLATCAFFLMGASVLHAQSLRPEGNETITVLSRMYTDTMGAWAGVAFLVGAIIVLGSTLWSTVPAYARLFTNAMGLLGAANWKDPTSRLRWFKALTVIFPILWGVEYLFMQTPVWMVLMGGTATGIYLLVVVIAVLYLRRTEVDKNLYGTKIYVVFFAVSVIAISLLAVYTIANVLFGFSIG